MRSRSSAGVDTGLKGVEDALRGVLDVVEAQQRGEIPSAEALAHRRGLLDEALQNIAAMRKSCRKERARLL